MQIKLIIWDLDETLWRGSLAEGDGLHLYDHRVEIVRALNRHGIVSSICSKNDPTLAEAELRRFEIWDQFVFPRIAFTPKGAAIKQLIEDMQLRPVNVLFIDDNIHNLEEARHLVPELNVVDASKPECDTMLARILEANKHVSRSRVEEYRMLQVKLADRAVQSGTNESFLATCGLHIAVARGMDNLDFADRIEDLINRTNQLNFTKSRVATGSMADFIADISRIESWSVFAWDKYGYHGLIGFVAIEKNTPQILHYTFSCRIMNMGIECGILERVLKYLPGIDAGSLGVLPEAVSWITEEDFYIDATRSFILQKESIRSNKEIKLRIMTDCQSGAIAHFSGLEGVAEYDNQPRVFNLRLCIDESYRQQIYPPFLVYGAFVDLHNKYWPADLIENLETGIYAQCATRFCEFVGSKNCKLLAILAPENVGDEKYLPRYIRGGVTRHRVASFQNTWRQLAKTYHFVTLLELAEIANPEELIDLVHYEVSLLKRISDRVRDWYCPEDLR